MSKKTVAERIREGLEEFTRKLESGEPIEATRVERIKTPDASPQESDFKKEEEKEPTPTPWSGPHFPKGTNGWCNDINCLDCNGRLRR